MQKLKYDSKWYMKKYQHLYSANLHKIQTLEQQFRQRMSPYIQDLKSKANSQYFQKTLQQFDQKFS